jgi:hypothetical protein
VALSGAEIRERTAQHGDELPVVARGVKGQLEDAGGGVVPDLAVRGPVTKSVISPRLGAASGDP